MAYLAISSWALPVNASASCAYSVPSALASNARIRASIFGSLRRDSPPLAFAGGVATATGAGGTPRRRRRDQSLYPRQGDQRADHLGDHRPALQRIGEAGQQAPRLDAGRRRELVDPLLRSPVMGARQGRLVADESPDPLAGNAGLAASGHAVHHIRRLPAVLVPITERGRPAAWWPLQDGRRPAPAAAGCRTPPGRPAASRVDATGWPTRTWPPSGSGPTPARRRRCE